MEDDGFWADDLYAKVLLGDGGVLPDRDGGREGAVLGVGAAAAGGIEVGDAGRRASIPAAMVEDLIEGGQSNPAPGEQRQEEDGVQASDDPAHANSRP